MATLEVNKNSMYFDSSNYLNLKSLLPKLQREFPLDLYELALLKVNGRLVDINSEDPSLVRPIEQNDVIEINFDRNNVLISDIVTEAHDLADKIIEKITQTSHLLNENEEKYFEKVITIISAVDTFIKSITFIHENIKNSNQKVHSLPFKELHIHLLSIMKALNTAQSKNDHIMLADLLEYELKDNLTQWKILIMPTLRHQSQIQL